jgi:DNA recombination protein RmuC
MEIIVILSSVILLLGGLLVFSWFRGGKKDPSQEALLLMQQQVEALRRQFSEGLNQNQSLLQQQLAQVTAQVNSQLSSVTSQIQNTTGQIGNRLDNAARVVGEVKQNLGELSRATQQVFEVGKNIASLQEILRAPKLRGNLGELFLGELLSQILPPSHYSLQHRFRSGEAVDAIIRLGAGMVPVDSKFPLENFKRLVGCSSDEERRGFRKQFVSDVKKHIDKIADKYIVPDEGTFPFALIYIPAENVYYETIIKDEAFGDEKSLSAYAIAKRVIPVSPNSFYAYLQAIVMGLQGLKIEKSAQEIIARLSRLTGDFERFRKEFEIVGSHLTNARSKYEEAAKRLDRFGEKLLSAPEGGSPSNPEPVKEPLVVEEAKPVLFD